MTGGKDAIQVLLVDDEADLLRSTEKALARRGFRVATASGRVGALAALREREIDAAVLDVKMPDVDGHDLFYELRAQAPRLAVIMLTGHGSIGRAFATARDGLFHYLIKPCEVDVLAETIRAACGREANGTRDAGLDEGIVHVLIADDDEEFGEELSRVLAGRGTRVHRAKNAARCLEVLSAEPVDVALVNVQAPGSNGLALVTEIKRLWPMVELILLTGYGTVDLAVAGLKLGAFDFLVKPQPAEDLAAKVLRAARQKLRAQRELQDKDLGRRVRREGE